MRAAWLCLGSVVTACGGHSAARGDASGSDAAATDASDAGGGSGIPLPNAPHGVFILNPPSTGAVGTEVNDTFLAAAAPGKAYVAGATLQVHWSDLQPNGPSTLALDGPTQTTVAAWTAQQKLVNLVFQASNYTGSSFMPTWYTRTLTITTATQPAGSKTITVVVANSVDASQGGFLVDTNPDGIKDTDQAIQIAGTASLDGVYPIATITNNGATTTVTMTAPTAATTLQTTTSGTIGNPVFLCPMETAPLPVYWGPNFIAAWKNLIDLAKTNLDGDHYGYFRFGMGTGGENSPVKPLTSGCETILDSLGFSSETVPWTNYGPTGANAADWEDKVAMTWLGFEQTMIAYVANEQFTTTALVSLSTISYDKTQGIDYDTADAEGVIIHNTADPGVGMGNQGWRESDGTTTDADVCAADYCAIFHQWVGTVPLELQTTLASDPGNTTANAPDTGNLANMFTPAIGRGVQILEIYTDDYLCAFDPSFAGDDSNPMMPYVSSYSDCATAGFPSAFQTAAMALD